MRYLKAAGYRAVSMEDFLGFLRQRRQLPKKTVVLTFDDGYKSFIGYAYPLLKELGFAATLFIQTDQIASKPNPNLLSWSELHDLVQQGVEIYPHGKTHQDLRRRPGESPSAYERRMLQELVVPLNLLRKNLDRPAIGLEVIAYPSGTWDEDLLRSLKEHGYQAGFTERRQGNPAFVPFFKINRSPIYADGTMEDFKASLGVLQPHTPPLPGMTATAPPRTPPSSSAARSKKEQLAALHNERADELESRGALRQALDERDIALTIAPDDADAAQRRRQLASRIESEVAAHMEEWRRTARRAPAEASRQLLAALAIDPTSHPAFDALRAVVPAGRFLSHTVRPRDTAASLADLYYGDRGRAGVIEQANGLEPNARLTPGTVLMIPEIEGVPFLRPDR
jgi:peptidoglycan/xylan/chitin deacetylase (PgdA/CDA1 family)